MSADQLWLYDTRPHILRVKNVRIDLKITNNNTFKLSTVVVLLDFEWHKTESQSHENCSFTSFKVAVVIGLTVRSIE